LFNQKNALIFATTRFCEPPPAEKQFGQGSCHETRNVQGSDTPGDATTMVAGYQKKIIFIK